MGLFSPPANSPVLCGAYDREEAIWRLIKPDPDFLPLDLPTSQALFYDPRKQLMTPNTWNPVRNAEAGVETPTPQEDPTTPPLKGA